MKKAIECENIQEIRSAIDQIDQQIVKLISNRSEYVQAAAKFKNNEAAVRDVDRVNQVIESKKILAQTHGVSPELIGKLYTIMIEHFVNEELEEAQKHF